MQGLKRPHTTIVLAISADGKIADAQRSPPRFGSPADKAHLESQVAQADGVLFGAATLRAGGTAMKVVNPDLIQRRLDQGKPPQPVQIVCSGSAKIDPQLRFFRQVVPRWLLTTPAGAVGWQERPEFEQVLVISEENSANPAENQDDWIPVFEQLAELGLQRLAILGGGELIASLLAVDLVDELWLTICPLLLGGANAPTPVDGVGFAAEFAPRLELLSAQPIEQEVFLHYRLNH